MVGTSAATALLGRPRQSSEQVAVTKIDELDPAVSGRIHFGVANHHRRFVFGGIVAGGTLGENGIREVDRDTPAVGVFALLKNVDALHEPHDAQSRAKDTLHNPRSCGLAVSQP